jgi:hypothetical protein
VAIPTADRDDLVTWVQIHLFDSHGHAKDLGLEWDDEVFLQHREEADSLFRLPIGIDNRFLDERVEISSAETRASAGTARWRHGSVRMW